MNKMLLRFAMTVMTSTLIETGGLLSPRFVLKAVEASVSGVINAKLGC